MNFPRISTLLSFLFFPAKNYKLVNISERLRIFLVCCQRNYEKNDKKSCEKAFRFFSKSGFHKKGGIPRGTVVRGIYHYLYISPE